MLIEELAATLRRAPLQELGRETWEASEQLLSMNEKIRRLEALIDEYRSIAERLAVRLLCETPTGYRQTESNKVLYELGLMPISESTAHDLADDHSLTNWMENHV